MPLVVLCNSRRVFLYDIFRWDRQAREWALLVSCEAIQQAETAYDNAVYRGYHVKMVNRATGRTIWHDRH